MYQRGYGVAAVRLGLKRTFFVMAGLDPAIHENAQPCDQITDEITESEQISK